MKPQRTEFCCVTCTQVKPITAASERKSGNSFQCKHCYDVAERRKETNRKKGFTEEHRRNSRVIKGARLEKFITTYITNKE